MKCSCPCACESRVELRFHHGTPDKFAQDVWKAYYDGYLTHEECRNAIAAYRREYLSTPERLQP